MLDDSAETVVFPSSDSSLHQQEPGSTTNHDPLYNIQSQKLQVLLYFQEIHFALYFSTWHF